MISSRKILLSNKWLRTSSVHGSSSKWFSTSSDASGSDSGPESPGPGFKAGVVAVVIGMGALALGGLSVSLKAEKNRRPNETPSLDMDMAGVRKEGLPDFKSEDICKHDSPKNRIWVTYRSGVYDITDFIPKHPGSDKIMMAAGSSVEPFWNVYAVHKKKEISEMLENYRIGNLHPSEVDGDDDEETNNIWANEPRRHRLLKPTNLTPFNAETPLLFLCENFFTPNELFYVRNHLAVPDLEENDYSIDIEIQSTKKEVTLNLSDLKKFPKHNIVATIQCGGNRRADMNKEKKVAGLAWEGGAIGNAKWSGARLVDVLQAAGVNEKDPKIKHVQFEGADLGADGAPYGVSIPASKGLNYWGDVILAYEMNGEPLSRDHGYPLRVIVPGSVAAKSVKWLQKIVLSDKESDSHWQQKDYKILPPNVTDNPNFSGLPGIQATPITSAITEPFDGAKVKVSRDGTINLKGYAYSGGGNSVVRVEISVDGEKSWREAKLLDQPGQDTDSTSPNWSWTIWRAKVPVPKGQKEIQICCRAVDSCNNIQPQSYSGTWNLRGFLSNAYSRINVKIE